MRQKLTKDMTKYKMPPKMKAMIQNFHDTIAISTFSKEEYNVMIQDTES